MNAPKLIVMSGLPGSGKSTLSEKIARRLKLLLLSVDPIESAVIKAGIAKGFKTGYAAYLVAETLAQEQIKLGNSVIIDAVNAEDEAKQIWVGCSTRLNVPLVVIECVLKDTDLHRARVETRNRGLHGLDEITWEQVEDRRKAYTQWKQEILSVEMSDSADKNLKMALSFIARQH